MQGGPLGEGGKSVSLSTVFKSIALKDLLEARVTNIWQTLSLKLLRLHFIVIILFRKMVKLTIKRIISILLTLIQVKQLMATLK